MYASLLIATASNSPPIHLENSALVITATADSPSLKTSSKHSPLSGLIISVSPIQLKTSPITTFLLSMTFPLSINHTLLPFLAPFGITTSPFL